MKVWFAVASHTSSKIGFYPLKSLFGYSENGSVLLAAPLFFPVFFDTFYQ
jgi:hypothetical protein